jgi:hypothetical protein
MNEILRDLAAGASAYLKELRDRDVPYELAEILVRDWHHARLVSYFGLAQAGTPIWSISSAPNYHPSTRIQTQNLTSQNRSSHP